MTPEGCPFIQKSTAMSRFIYGYSVQVMGGFPDKSTDFILTDPPYLVGFNDRSGRTIANDVNSEWVLPARREMYRVLKNNSLAVSFYGWNRVDTFMQAWREAGFALLVTWFSPSPMPQSLPLSAISMKVPGSSCGHCS